MVFIQLDRQSNPKSEQTTLDDFECRFSTGITYVYPEILVS
ncbi:MAG: hypothetical protein ACFFEV_06935 [Candidatus Thorarchaeota archaeon]